MRTWQSAYEKAQRVSGDPSTETLEYLKEDINEGAAKFNAALNRYFTRKAKTTDLVADQQYYQMPPDSIRPIGVVVTVGSDKYPLQQIRSEYDWRALNIHNQSSNWVSYYFVRGADEIGLYPIPSTAVTDGLEIYYEPRDHELSQDDYTTGTVTVTNGSTTVTGSSTVFTDAFAGRWFKVTDGTDGHWYRISSRTSNTELTLEEPYIGLSGSGKTYLIGESFSFPGEYHDAPVDYALHRYFEERDQPERAAYHLAKFNKAIDTARSKYASSSQSTVITDQVEARNIWTVPPDAITT